MQVVVGAVIVTVTSLLCVSKAAWGRMGLGFKGSQGEGFRIQTLNPKPPESESKKPFSLSQR